MSTNLKCQSCDKKVTKKENGILCSLCGNFYHIGCQNINTELHNLLLSEHEGIHWYCKMCNSWASTLIKSLKNIEQKQAKIEANAKEMVNRIDSLEQSITQSEIAQERELEALTEVKTAMVTLEMRIANLEKRENPDKDKEMWSTTVEKQIKRQMSKMKQEVVEVQKVIQETKLDADEEKERDKKRNNIIIFNIPESDEAANDKKFCMSLFTNILDVECDVKDIKRIFRLGIKTEDKMRPVLIEFSSHSSKNAIMESLHKLRDAEEKFKNLSISHDLTSKERNELKNLVQEA